MILVITQGIGYGLLLAMTIGPVFFALIRTSIDKGFRSGAYLAFGIALSDSLAATIVYFGISQFTQNPIFQSVLGYLGGSLMILFGLHPFLKPLSQKKFTPGREFEKVKGIRFILEGILLNLLNPFVYIIWLVAVSFITMSDNYTSPHHFLFFLGIITTVFSTDILKAYIANKITNFINARMIAIIDKVAGICLLGFGVHLLFSAYFGIY